MGTSPALHRHVLDASALILAGILVLAVSPAGATPSSSPIKKTASTPPANRKTSVRKTSAQRINKAAKKTARPQSAKAAINGTTITTVATTRPDGATSISTTMRVTPTTDSQATANAATTVPTPSKGTGSNAATPLSTRAAVPTKTAKNGKIPGLKSLTAVHSKVEKPVAPAADKIWAVKVNLGRSRSMYPQSEENLKESTDFLADVIIQTGDNWKFLTEVAYSKDERDPEGSDWADTLFVLSRKGYEITPVLRLAPSLIAIAPTSKPSIENKKMQGAVGGGLGLSFAETSLPKGLALGLSVNVIRLSHDFETAEDGTVNNQWSSRQRLTVDYAIGPIGLSLALIHRNSLTYGGTLKETFEHAEEIDYNINDSFFVGIGHTLAGNALKPNGQDSNYAVVNERDSLVYALMGASF